MSAPSDSLDDLQSDIGHVAVLIATIQDLAINVAMPENEAVAKGIQQVQSLLWIARDLSENLNVAAEACHQKVMRDFRTPRSVRS